MIRRLCRGPQPARRDRGVHGSLDHAAAEMALQLAPPHQVRQPGIRQQRPVPAGHRRAVTTRRQNTASSPADGTRPPATTVMP